MNQTEGAEVFTFVGEAKFAAETFHDHIADDEVGLRRGAISNDGALDTGNDGLDVWLIETEDCRAVKRHAIDKLDEDGLNFFKGAVLIEMFAVDGGDDGDYRRVVKEA